MVQKNQNLDIPLLKTYKISNLLFEILDFNRKIYRDLENMIRKYPKIGQILNGEDLIIMSYKDIKFREDILEDINSCKNLKYMNGFIPLYLYLERHNKRAKDVVMIVEEIDRFIRNYDVIKVFAESGIKLTQSVDINKEVLTPYINNIIKYCKQKEIPEISVMTNRYNKIVVLDTYIYFSYSSDLVYFNDIDEHNEKEYIVRNLVTKTDGIYYINNEKHTKLKDLVNYLADRLKQTFNIIDKQTNYYEVIKCTDTNIKRFDNLRMCLAFYSNFNKDILQQYDNMIKDRKDIKDIATKQNLIYFRETTIKGLGQCLNIAVTNKNMLLLEHIVNLYDKQDTKEINKLKNIKDTEKYMSKIIVNRL